VFNPTSQNHEKYIPILDWIAHKNGKIVVGGSKYKRELRSHKSQSILAEYERSRKLVKISDYAVDKIAADIKRAVNDKNFDDEHLVALVSVSKCKVICTDDKRAYPYLKRNDLYPHGVKRPRFYQTARNASLCCAKYAADVCR
jgi:hypothetical protein